MLKNNGNYQKIALETVKYEVHGGGASGAPTTTNVTKT